MKFLLMMSSSLFASKNMVISKEPKQEWVDSRLRLQLGVISSLIKFQEYGYRLILIVENQFFRKSRELNFLIEILLREGVLLEKVFNQKKMKEELLVYFQQIGLTNKELYLVLHRKSQWIEKDFFQKKIGINQIFFDESLRKDDPKKGCFHSWQSLSSSFIFKDRVYQVERKTSETYVWIRINLDGKGKSKIDTGLNFFNHMLDNFSKHSKVDLEIRVKGDLEVDEHHTIEDTAITLAGAFKQAWSDKRGIARYGFVLPMDESETACSLDLSGRGHLEWQAQFSREYVGDFPTEMLQHFYYSFCINAGININMKITGKNDHHQIESSFKALAQCIKQAVKREGTDLPSTKGLL